MPPLTVPFAFASAGLNTPTTQLDANNAAILAWINARNPTIGPIGARPPAGNAGALWVASDLHNQLSLDDGAVWQDVSEFSLVLVGQATPATPAAGSLLLYSPLGDPPLQRPAWIDSAGQLFDVAAAMAAPRLVGHPAKVVSATLAETSFYASAPTIKGGTLGTTRGIRLSVIGDLLNNTGVSHGFTLKAKYGGTTVGTFAAPGVATSATRYLWSLTVWLTALGTTMDQAAWGALIVAATPGNTGTSETFAGTANALSGYTSFSEDSTVDQTLDLTVTLPVTTATLIWRVFSVTAELFA